MLWVAGTPVDTPQESSGPNGTGMLTAPCHIPHIDGELSPTLRLSLVMQSRDRSKPANWKAPGLGASALPTLLAEVTVGVGEHCPGSWYR